MLATARIPAATGMQASRKSQHQQQKCQQQQVLRGKAIKVAGKEPRNVTVNMNVAVKKKRLYP
jgi:hypothetical protein